MQLISCTNKLYLVFKGEILINAHETYVEANESLIEMEEQNDAEGVTIQRIDLRNGRIKQIY